MVRRSGRWYVRGAKTGVVAPVSVLRCHRQMVQLGPLMAVRLAMRKRRAILLAGQRKVIIMWGIREIIRMEVIVTLCAMQ